MFTFFKNKNISILLFLYALFFGFLFPVLSINFANFNKKIEIYLFLSIFFIINFFWFLFLKYKRANRNEMIIESNKYLNTNPNYFWISFLSISFFFVFFALLGNNSNFITIDLFSVYKEFGMHVDALWHFNAGIYYWIDYAYPYGFYPILLSFLLSKFLPIFDSVLLANIILNFVAIFLFLFVLYKNTSKSYFLLGSFSFLVYIFPRFLHSFYSGLQSNLLRYCCVLLVFLFVPRNVKKRSQVLIFGFSLGLLFFITPEFLPLIVLLVLYSIYYLLKNEALKNIIYIFIGIFLSSLPFLFFLNLDNFGFGYLVYVFNNIFYQAKFIINQDGLSHFLPNLIYLSRELFLNFGLNNIKEFYLGVLFYVPPFFVSWLFYVWYLNKKDNFLNFRILILLFGTFFIYFKSLGAASVGYALLATPVIIFSYCYVLNNVKIKINKTKLVSIVFVVLFVFIFSVYDLQQNFFPCLTSKTGYACNQLKVKGDLEKINFDHKFSIIIKYSEDDIYKNNQILSFLNNFNRENILNLTDASVLNLFLETYNRSRVMIPSLLFEKKEIDKFIMHDDLDLIILPAENYNFVDLDFDNKFLEVKKELENNFYYFKRCGPFEFYINNKFISIDFNKDLNCLK